MMTENFGTDDRGEPDIKQMFTMLPRALQGHGRRVAKAAAYLFGIIRQEELYEEERADCTPWEVEQIVLYHDIGFLLYPDILSGTAPLFETGVLTRAGRDALWGHTVCGAGLIEKYRQSRALSPGETALWRLAAEVAISHHESWNGKGYPHGELATAIPLISRITAVVNSYDGALWGLGRNFCSSPEAALQELSEQAGIQLDPRLTAKFKEALRGSDTFSHIFQVRDWQDRAG